MWLPTREVRSDRIVLEANPDHWNRARGPHVERVVYRNDITPTKALDLVCDGEGEVDVLSEVSPADAQRVIDSEHAQLAVVDAMRMVSGIINRDVNDAPLDDVRARRALNLAVDRDALVADVFGGYAYPLAGMTPPYASGLPDGIAPYPHDPKQARRLLAEAGWPDGRALRLAATSDVAAVAAAVAAQFGDALGIDVEPIMIAGEDVLSASHMLVEKVMPLPFDVMIHAWFDLASDAPPAVVHREYYHSGGAFRAGPVIDEFEQLLVRFATQIDADAQRQAAEAIDQLAYDQALSVFLIAPQALYAVNRHVDFVGHAATFELAETSVSADHWSRR